jgi:hypothetical protein
MKILNFLRLKLIEFLTHNYKEIICEIAKLMPDIAKEHKLNPRTDYTHALYVMKGRFAEGEEAISESAEFSYRYAKQIKSRFILGEQAISEDAWYSFLYARDVIDGRFELGEEAIFSSEDYKSLYFDLINF